MRSYLQLTVILGAAAGWAMTPGTSRAEVSGLTRVATGFSSPTFVTHAPGDPNRMFVVEQAGVIRVFDRNTGAVQSQPFLDIQGFVEDSGNEEGLLGLAFHPEFQTNGKFYVNYIYGPTTADDTRVDEFVVDDPANDLVANSNSRRTLLQFDQDFSNHNGGWLGFSPNDGMLYISTGDGGSGNDPNDRGQSLDTYLGKILRIDVDVEPGPNAPAYKIPADNPFASDGHPDTFDEIWAYGLRNPWRASFDRATGDFWIGDVGQNNREEIDFQPADSTGGENYGWRLREGNIATPTGGVGGPEPVDHVPPVYDYDSDGVGPFGGNSVVGGYVYRGPDPEVQGRYFFGDTVNTHVWSFYPDDPMDSDTTVEQLTNLDSLLTPDVGSKRNPTAFGEDLYGNLYLVSQGGDIFRIETDATLPGDYNGDGTVDTQDYDVWRANFGSDEALGADGNQDGLVNAADYTLWRDNLGQSISQPQLQASRVPEPSAGTVAAMLGLILALGRRRASTAAS